MLNLLISGYSGFTAEELESIRAMGYAVTSLEREDSPEIPEPWKYDVTVCNWLFARHDIHDFTGLRAVQLLSAGLDRMPMDYAAEKGIIVANARGIYSVPIAEFTVMAVLDVYKHSGSFYEAQKQHLWQKDRSLRELAGKRVCIVGTGSVGTEMAKRFSAFTDSVSGIDLYPAEKPYFSDISGLDRLEEKLGESDVVILTLPLSDETYHLFGDRLLSRMKDDAVLVNVARGGIIDEEALKRALDAGKFMCVILDVFEHEPLESGHWCWEAERVRVIPHNTFVSDRNDERLKALIMADLADWSKKLAPSGESITDRNE